MGLKKEDAESYDVIAPSTDDAFLYHIFFQLLALPVALKNEKIREEHLANATAKVIHTHALDRKVYAIPGKVKPEDLEHPRLTGYLTKKFDEVINEDNIPKLAKTWVEGLREAEIYGVSEEEVEQYMRKAREIAKKIKKYLHGDRVSTRDLGKENPMIWSALNVEEFRRFLAEISGKKIEAKKPKFPATKKALFPELLAIAKALEYSAFSPEAMKRAEEDLLERLDKLLESPEENALEIAYTVKLLMMVQKRDVKGIKRFAK